jgi:hypothetical protein
MFTTAAEGAIITLTDEPCALSDLEPEVPGDVGREG